MNGCWRRQWRVSLEVWPSLENTKTLPSYSVSCKIICSFDILINVPIKIPTFAVKKGDVYSAKVLKALENIDDECDENGIIFIKVVILKFSFERCLHPLVPDWRRVESSKSWNCRPTGTCIF